MSLYGLIIGICLAIGSDYFLNHNTLIPKNREIMFVLGLLISSVVGARAYHVLDQWSYYSHYPIQILNTRAGGLGIYGGLGAGLLFVFIFCRLYKIQFLQLLNSFVTIVPLCQAIGRWGNFFNTEGFGLPTHTGFGQFIPQYFRPIQYIQFSYFHPVWLYESILDLVLFLWLRKKHTNQTGNYLIGYGLIRLFTEFFRFDTWQIDNIKVAQVISVLIFLIGIIVLIRSSRIHQKTKS